MGRVCPFVYVSQWPVGFVGNLGSMLNNDVGAVHGKSHELGMLQRISDAIVERHVVA